MDTIEHIRIAKRAQDLSDEFYRRVSACLAARDAFTISQCLKLGREYAAALNDEIDYLTAIHQSDRRDAALSNCYRQQQTLASQITLLKNALDER